MIAREPRFDVVYHLYSLDHFHRLRLRCPVGDGEGECRIVGGTRVTDAGVAKLTALKKLKDGVGTKR